MQFVQSRFSISAENKPSLLNFGISDNANKAKGCSLDVFFIVKSVEIKCFRDW